MHKYVITAVCIISLLLCSGRLIVHASTTYGFETTNLSEEEKNEIWQNINISSFSDDISLDNIRAPSISFDVSKNGMMLLGFKGNKVAVADENGKVVHYLGFSDDGTFYVQWSNNNILLLLVRGSIIIEVSPSGQLINMIETDESSI